MKVITDMGPRTVNIFWQVPLYVIITLGECLFSITGLSFAYSQVRCSLALCCAVIDVLMTESKSYCSRHHKSIYSGTLRYSRIRF